MRKRFLLFSASITEHWKDWVEEAESGTFAFQSMLCGSKVNYYLLIA